MGALPTPESSLSYWGSIKGALGLFGDTNKAQGIDENSQIIPADEYESSLADDKIIELVGTWKRDYETYYTDISKTQDLAYDYWIGRHRVEDGVRTGGGPLVDNVMFEAIETFLPMATRANPDPLVTADPSTEGQALAKDLKNALVHEADTQKLRRKMAKACRHWLINRIGVAKIAWDVKTQSIKTEIVNGKRMVFDKDGHVDEGGRFIGEYIGEKKMLPAESLAELFPKKKEYILERGQQKKGTKLEFYEWWYHGTDNFFTLDEEVLGKFKNPHWNYDGAEVVADPETGAETQDPIQGTNHFKEPQAPYVFLAMFNTGLRPHDDTSLILQNVPLQDVVNRRWNQLDQNIEGMNNGMAVDGNAFTEEQASQAAAAARRGVAFRVPGKAGQQVDVRAAVMRLPAPPLPRDVPENLNDAREQVRNLFGTSGSTPSAAQQEDTVRGKVLVAQQDTSRIGGGITEQLEQFADSIYNWWVQMMVVYWSEEHFVSAAGEQGGMELASLINTRFMLVRTLDITVKEGSLIPRNPLAQRNEAMDLWGAGAIDPVNFFKALDEPDPVNAAKQLMLWQMFQKGQVPPTAYLPSFDMSVMPPPVPMETPGIGGPAVNDLDNSPTLPPQQDSPASPEAVSQEQSQLLQAAGPA